MTQTNTICDCCKTREAHWIITTPTDATEIGEIRCDECAQSTCSDFARIRIADSETLTGGELVRYRSGVIAGDGILVSGYGAGGDYRLRTERGEIFRLTRGEFEVLFSEGGQS